jgi:hypothetical protein
MVFWVRESEHGRGYTGFKGRGPMTRLSPGEWLSALQVFYEPMPWTELCSLPGGRRSQIHDSRTPLLAENLFLAKNVLLASWHLNRQAGS